MATIRITHNGIRAERDRYMTCAKCGSTRAQISPIGLLCPNCSFPKEGAAP